MFRDRTTDDAQDLFSRGHKALSEGEYHEAIECFSRAIGLRPEVSAGYRFRAYAYLELGDRVRALNDLDQAIRLKPDDPQMYADRAEELFLQKMYDLAVADCDRVLELDPGRVGQIALRGRCHAARGDTESALRDFASAIEGDPDNAARYLLWRSHLNLECENFVAAEADCTLAIGRNQADAEAYYLRGTVRQQSNDLEGAILDFSNAIQVDPNHALARLGRAICLFTREDFPGAIADSDESIRLSPGVVRAYEVRGSAHVRLGNLQEAFDDFSEAIRLAPGMVMPYNCRAGVHYARGEYSAAIREHMEALKRDPRHAGTFNQLGWIWATCPDPDVRNGERARECATRACELTEWTEPGYLDTLAAACAECGEFDEAVRWQEKAIASSTPEMEADLRTRLELYFQRKPARFASHETG